MEKELRRSQSILAITGFGALAFGLWDIIKTNLLFFLAGTTMFGNLEGVPPEAGGIVFALAYMFLMFFALISFAMRIYIAIAAGREATNTGRFKPYLGLVIWLIIVRILVIILSVTGINLSEHLFDQIASIIVDTTALIMMFELVSAARKTRRLRKQLTA